LLGAPKIVQCGDHYSNKEATSEGGLESFVSVMMNSVALAFRSASFAR
jgi:hypothetical protein